MAAPGSSFDTFYKDLKDTEKKDAVLTPKQQIDRLLRPGSTYRNLNPYEVLQIDPHVPIEDVRKKYRRMSILVHPDKNQDDVERAQAAFDALKKAYEMLQDEKIRAKCMEIVEEAEGRTKMAAEEKRRLARKKTKEANPVVDEDDPAKFKQAVQNLTMKLFADLERNRRTRETKASEEAAKKRELETLAEERRTMEKEWNKNWEESRQGRVNSWMDFRKGKTADPKFLAEKARQEAAAIAAQNAAAAGKPIETEPSQSARAAHYAKLNSTKVNGLYGAIPGNYASTTGHALLGEGPSSGASGGGKEKKKKKEKKSYTPLGFRPPKTKPEAR